MKCNCCGEEMTTGGCVNYRCPSKSSLNGNYSVQYDDIPLMVSKIAELTAKIARLVEVGDRMKHSMMHLSSANIGQFVCYLCGHHGATMGDIPHESDCPVTLWNKEAHE